MGVADLAASEIRTVFGAAPISPRLLTHTVISTPSVTILTVESTNYSEGVGLYIVTFAQEVGRAL